MRWTYVKRTLSCKGALRTSVQNGLEVSQVTIHCCFYHLTQSTWRKIRELGLATVYKENEDIKIFCAMVDSLAFLPLEDISDGMNYLKHAVASNQLVQESPGQDPKKTRKRVCKNLQAQMKNLCQARRDGHKSADEFLQGAGHNIQWKS